MKKYLNVVVVAMFCVVLILPTRGEDSAWVLNAIKERWQWEHFWKGAIIGGRYSPGQSVEIQLFEGKSAVGYCAPDLNYCISYERTGQRLGQELATSIASTADNGQSAVNAFIRNKAPHSTNWDSGTISFSTHSVKLPLIEPPECVGKRETPGNLGSLVKWLRERSIEYRGAKQYVMIPYYCKNDPLIYILFEAVHDHSAGIQIVLPQEKGREWNVVGQFEEGLSPRFPALSQRIKESAAWRGEIP